MMGISIGAILVGIALVIVSGIVVGAPLLTRSAMRWTSFRGESEEESPAERRTRVLQALRDLEFDYATGKVSEDDYKALRSQLLLEAASLVEASETGAGEEVVHPREQELDRLIERAVQAKRGLECPHCGHTVRPDARFCSMCGRPLASRLTCPQCKARVIPTARFCPACGTSLMVLYEAIL